jgi:hypothetical protein
MRRAVAAQMTMPFSRPLLKTILKTSNNPVPRAETKAAVVAGSMVRFLRCVFQRALYDILRLLTLTGPSQTANALHPDRYRRLM